MANRVTESIKHKTSLSKSRKNSATAMVKYAAWRRTNGGSSDVATITTLRSMPSGPRSSSTNSRASRLRSPIKPIILISANVWRAIIDRSVDFPTPDPAKIPILWPLQTVRKAFITLTPRSIFSPTRFRVWAGGGVF